MPEDNENIEPKTDRTGMDYKQGPNPAPGGKLDVDENAPPYADRTTGEDQNEETAASVGRQMEGSEAGTADQTASPAEESEVKEHEVSNDASDADKGVGESASRSGEEVRDSDGKEAGRHDLPPDSDTGRPAGTSDERDVSGI